MPSFSPTQLDEEAAQDLRHRYGLLRPFIMTTGRIDPHKNVTGLISAYAKLPSNLRAAHQLFVICPGPSEGISELNQYAKDKGLTADELVLTGFISDSDLITLYNSCKVFCLPSLYEGFGLPALEAMQCGAATIGSNTSSIPEVIGRPDALFDPRKQAEFTARLHQVLTNDYFRQSLIDHGLQQARNFSWDETARRAWESLESQRREIRPGKRAVAKTNSRPHLAYVSPVLPERSGIASYSSELLPELDRHYDIEVIIDQKTVADPWIKSNCAIRDVTWFEQHAPQFDRILYQFGNSPAHKHMFAALALHPGVVVLHDFYLSAVAADLELSRGWHGFWTGALYRSHGYSALNELVHAKDTKSIIYKYPVNFAVLENAHGIVVHSNYSKSLAQKFYGETFTNEWAVIPHLRRLPAPHDRATLRRALGFAEDDFLLCCFGAMDPTKLNHRLIEVWLETELSEQPHSYLVFVGEEHHGDYGAKLRRMMTSASKSIRVEGFASAELYRQYLGAADLAVQLRAFSRGETSGAAFDCLAYGVPTIVNAHASLAELPRNCVLMLPDEFTDEQLAAAIKDLRSEPSRGKALAKQARKFVATKLGPRSVADQYWSAIEAFYASSNEVLRARTLAAVAEASGAQLEHHEWGPVASAIDRNMPAPRPARQLLVDISSKVATELKSGIERVVRGHVLELASQSADRISD